MDFLQRNRYVIISAFSLEGAKNVAVWMLKTMSKIYW
jgi:hypothetical protein